MNTIKERAAAIAAAAQKLNSAVYNASNDHGKITEARTVAQQHSPKLVSLEEAIKQSGLKDGMTISFHHHFRGGDKVVNLVVGKLAEMGFKICIWLHRVCSIRTNRSSNTLKMA